MNLSVRDLDSLRVGALVGHAPAIDFPGLWHGLHAVLQATGAMRPGCAFLAVFKSSALGGPGAIDWYGAAVALAEGQTVAPPLEELFSDGGPFVTWIYEGAYEGLGEAWGGFGQALRAAGHRPDPARTCLEVYLDSGDAAADRKPRTELCVPILT